MDSEFEDNYQKFKEKKKLIQSPTRKGKLTPFKKLIERMVDDGFFQTDIKEHLEEQYNLKVSINSLFLFIKKLKEKKTIEMELINGTNFVAVPTPIKEKKIKPKKIPTPENETNKTIQKGLPVKVEENENSDEQKISKKLVLNLPVRDIKTGELKKADRSKFNY